MRYKTFAINLKSNEYRRDFMLAQQEKSGLDINILEAITPETMRGLPHRYDEAFTRKFTGRPLKPTELACGQSHFTLWRQLLNDPHHDFYLVLEDDAELCDGLAKLIESVDFKHIDFLKLSGKIKRKMIKTQELAQGRAVYKMAFGPLDTSAYIIGKQAIERLLSHCERFFAPIDIMMDRSFDHGVSIHCIYPYPVQADFCFDENSPMYTNVGDRADKYADDITISEKLWHRYYRLLGSVKRKRAKWRLKAEG